MNICLITANYWPAWGGAESQCRLLARELHRRGHDVVVLTRGRSDAPSEDQVDGVDVRRTLACGRGALRSLVWTLSATGWLRRHGRRFQVVQCYQLLSPSHVGTLARRRSSEQAVVLRPACSGPYGDIAEARRLPLTRMRQRLLRQADAFVTLTKDIEAELIDFGLEELPCRRIPNAVDTNRFHPGLRRSNAAGRSLGLTGKLASYIGRLAPQKGLGYLLEAWARVVTQEPDATLVLLGKGPQEGDLRASVERLEISQRVIFLGEQKDVRPLLAASELFILPSVAEGLSNALLEAMAMGLPCIATRVGGNADLIADGLNGLLVEAENAEHLAEALLRILRDPAFAGSLATAARQTVEHGYSLDHMVDQYLHLYRELLHHHEV